MRIPRPAAEKLGVGRQDPDPDGLLLGLIRRATSGCHEHAARANRPEDDWQRKRVGSWVCFEGCLCPLKKPIERCVHWGAVEVPPQSTQKRRSRVSCHVRTRRRAPGSNQSPMPLQTSAWLRTASKRSGEWISPQLRLYTLHALHPVYTSTGNRTRSLGRGSSRLRVVCNPITL